METITLVSLLDEDREQVMANIARDRALPAAQAALEKELDRVTYRYAEACGDAALRDSATHLLQAVKNTLPVMDGVGETRTWKKQYGEPEEKGFVLGGGALAALLGGLVLVLASVLAMLIAGRGGALAFFKVLLPVALGCGLLFWAGLLSARGKGPKPAAAGDAPTRTEYLADGEKLWHCLRGALVQADGQLERIREARAAVRAAAPSEAAPVDEVSPAALELFAGLLESAYAAGDEGARESASAIRFYLHGAGVEAVDFSAGRESWFEFLPAARPGTIRPALVSNGKLLKKGMASA